MEENVQNKPREYICILRMNEELTQIQKKVLENLTSTHGLLLRANRSIQAEGTYGIIKWNRQYKRIRRRGLKSVNLELVSICIGFNLYKYYLKKRNNCLQHKFRRKNLNFAHIDMSLFCLRKNLIFITETQKGPQVEILLYF